MKRILSGLALISISLIAAQTYTPNVENGKKLYVGKCFACHGMKAEKKALGVSKVINTFNEKDLVTALNGYKDGTYGGAMKGIMKTQVKSYNKNQIEDLAAYISTLNENKVGVKSVAYVPNVENGKKLYKGKCFACHGMNAEKKALGVSEVINTFNEKDLVTALSGYQDGTYGGAMKGIMKTQVKNYNKNQIDDIATYISTLKVK